MRMKKIDLEVMSVDDLWSLHEEIGGIPSAKGSRPKGVNSRGSWLAHVVQSAGA
jgi:hypothetical protein